jgi:hypothetical protein
MKPAAACVALQQETLSNSVFPGFMQRRIGRQPAQERQRKR